MTAEHAVAELRELTAVEVKRRQAAEEQGQRFAAALQQKRQSAAATEEQERAASDSTPTPKPAPAGTDESACNVAKLDADRADATAQRRTAARPKRSGRSAP
jgi:hypothetical protein